MQVVEPWAEMNNLVKACLQLKEAEVFVSVLPVIYKGFRLFSHYWRCFSVLWFLVSDCISPVFGTENRHARSLEVLIYCVTRLWAGALLKTEFVLPLYSSFASVKAWFTIVHSLLIEAFSAVETWLLPEYWSPGGLESSRYFLFLCSLRHLFPWLLPQLSPQRSVWYQINPGCHWFRLFFFRVLNWIVLSALNDF